jgi:putative Holliday junction resolvase
MTEGKIVGLDYGTKRIGVAISDELQMLARQLAIVPPKEIVKYLRGLIEQDPVVALVVGWPLNMSGEMSDKTREVEQFITDLQALGLPIHRMDERLSSQMAETMYGKKQPIDDVAASIILQNFLDTQKRN